jgi:hypothetical protein
MFRAGFLAAGVLAVPLCAAGDPPALAKNPSPQLAGKWTVTFANGVVETCEIRADWTASESEPRRSADGKVEGKDNALVITFADDRVERWTAVDKRVVVEHFFPGAEYPAGSRVLGIATFLAAPTPTRTGRTRTTSKGVGAWSPRMAAHRRRPRGPPAGRRRRRGRSRATP